MKIAYVVSRFPKITETFVLYEILELERCGVQVEVYPLIRERAQVIHPEYARLIDRTHYRNLLSFEVLAANLAALLGHPLQYFGTLFLALRSTLGSLNYFFGTLGIWPKAVLFARLMRASKVDQVHAHFANHPAMCAFLIQRLSGIPYSFTAHGSDLHVEQRALDLKIRHSRFTRMISRYNVQFVIDRFEESLRAKMQVIYCGIDPDVFQASPNGCADGLAATAAPRDRRKFDILCVAAFREVKGHAVLLEACRLLKERGLGFHCHLVGEGPLLGRIEKSIDAMGLRRQVTLHGALPRPKVVERMQDAQVLVLPSILDRDGRREGIPVTLMEAMACELAVVASDISGIPELITNGENGLLFRPGDANALSECLFTLAGAPELRKLLGRAARERVRADFDLRKNAQQLVAALRS